MLSATGQHFNSDTQKNGIPRQHLNKGRAERQKAELKAEG
jgi:hypothetical protein